MELDRKPNPRWMNRASSSLAYYRGRSKLLCTLKAPGQRSDASVVTVHSEERCVVRSPRKIMPATLLVSPEPHLDRRSPRSRPHAGNAARIGLRRGPDPIGSRQPVGPQAPA